MQPVNQQRRRFIAGLAASPVAALALPAAASPTLPQVPDAAASSVAQDEAFWKEVAAHYDRASGILNLEHGYWAKMAHPVQEAYSAALHRVNVENSYYARKAYLDDDAAVRARVAFLLGARDDEVVITRNATEACHNLIRQYRGLGPGDAVLLADIDYPGFKPVMRWLAESRGVEVVELSLPSRCDQATVLSAYEDAFEAHPNLRLALATHASNQHGLVIPIAAIASAARSRGIDVICDAAQSWGLLDYTVDELGVDWAVFNLHKWIGAPLGTGAMYMRNGTLDRVAPYPGESDPENTDAGARIHSGTVNFAARLAIPAAIEFHEAVGPANKEARLRYLRSLWTDEALTMDHIEVLGGEDESAWSGIASFRLPGRSSLKDATELQLRMEKEFGIFTVVRKGLASGSCVRITPQVFNTPDDIEQLVSALRKLRA